MKTQPSDNGQRSVWGVVGYQGVVLSSGSGDWMVVKTGTGQYAIHLHKPYKIPPVVTVGSSGAQIAASGASYQDSFNIFTYSAGGAATDGSFSFTATGR